MELEVALLFEFGVAEHVAEVEESENGGCRGVRIVGNAQAVHVVK